MLTLAVAVDRPPATTLLTAIERLRRARIDAAGSGVQAALRTTSAARSDFGHIVGQDMAVGQVALRKTGLRSSPPQRSPEHGGVASDAEEATTQPSFAAAARWL